MEIFELVSQLYALDELIRWGGYLVLFAIVFAETGLLVGFFLPGDSLLVTAGLFAAQGDLNILFLQVLLSSAAIIGDSLGYYIGIKTGKKIFHKEKSLFFAKDHLIKTREFYERHGGKTIILARFMPIIRTFAPIVAGVGEMQYVRFVFYNVFGGIGWVASMTLTGYFLGSVIPNIDEHLHIVIAVVIFLSILPGIIELIKSRRRERRNAFE
ncbi:MAG: VTT domain-containing protein [Candidatus Tectomicrobia bacterium]|uniref:VTT domain-containing protein n=1 Tax=Tectimicrobiota bacterium TaxID=2528274 RepID=A0A932FVK5_UNCTE|nr:VTT domain-containing protein [Candidatus Tectomicrobia bacterium]